MAENDSEAALNPKDFIDTSPNPTEDAGLVGRQVRHRGNHKYAWALSRRVRLPPGLLYPKQVDR